MRASRWAEMKTESGGAAGSPCAASSAVQHSAAMDQATIVVSFNFTLLLLDFWICFAGRGYGRRSDRVNAAARGM
jgi:hypothetical protein